ncbi:hypothetical protein ES703_27093 [subsurface metagenome]
MEEKFTFKSMRELRNDKGLSQLELAKKSGVSREFINRVEQGHLHLSGFTAPRIAKALGNVSYKSLIMAQELANHGLSESERKETIKIALKEAEGLSPGSISVIKTIRDFDYGDRDSWGRKKSKKEIEVEKRAEKRAEKDKEIDEFDRNGFGRRISKREADLRRKEAKKKRGDFSFGDRDSFGRKIVKNAEADQDIEVDENITLKELFEKDESTFEERLRKLLLKGEQSRKEREMNE